MADLSGQAYAPQPVDIVGDVGALKRVVGGLLVSNPLQNALTTSGLMQWLGHYGGFFLWIGEFFPGDPNFHQPDGSIAPQRGFSLVRDDAKQQSAFAVYDWDPYQGGPLRQKITMHDADGRNILVEGESGGWGWPRLPIYMGDIGYSNSTVDQSMASGRSQVVGRHIDYLYNLRALATTTVNSLAIPAPFNGPGAHTTHSYVQVQIGSDVITTPTVTGDGFFQGTIDLGQDWFSRSSDFMLIDLHAWVSPATATCLLCEPVQFHNVTLFTNRQAEGF